MVIKTYTLSHSRFNRINHPAVMYRLFSSISSNELFPLSEFTLDSLRYLEKSLSELRDLESFKAYIITIPYSTPDKKEKALTILDSRIALYKDKLNPYLSYSLLDIDIAIKSKIRSFNLLNMYTLIAYDQI
jgi:hypothetical protein